MPNLRAILTALPILVVTLPLSPALAQSQDRTVDLELVLAAVKDTAKP